MNQENLYKKTKKNGKCIEYMGYINKHGYAYTTFERKSWSLHRLSYFFAYGKIPKNKWVLHKCDNRKCINPLHLFLGNNKINTQDRVNKKRSAFGEKSGTHKLTINEVKNIKILFKNGATISKVSKIYNKVNYSTIRKIKIGEYWNHVTI